METLKAKYGIFKSIAACEDSISSAEYGLAIFEKLCWSIMHSIYPGKFNKVVSPCVLRADGCIYKSESDTASISLTGEFISHEMFSNSTLTETVFAYYKQSPYWDCDYSDAVLSRESLEFMGLCEKEDDLPPVASDFEGHEEWNLHDVMEDVFLDKDRKPFFEKAAVDIMDAFALNPMDYFMVDYESEWGEYIVFRSKLLPHYLRFLDSKPSLEEEDGQCTLMVEDAVSLLKDFLGKGSMTVMEPNLEYSYFLSFTEIGCGGYVFPYGTYSLKKELMIAGEVIDRGILLLNKKYSFLPEDLFKKEDMEDERRK